MAAETRPTPKQMKLLRNLASERGQSFAYPSTSAEARREISRLLKTKRSHRSEIAADRAAVGREAREALDGALVRRDEVQGYGSSATWRRTA
jgi:phage terminase large subunit-like protein